jgi:hypothetical protein
MATDLSSNNRAKSSFISANLPIEVKNRSNKIVIEERQMFGRVKYMFRFTFTTGIDDIPVAAVDWANFRCDLEHRVCSIGMITEQEWNNGPTQNPIYKQYLPMDEIFPSRYSLAYDELRFGEVQCAFISLDPERVGDNLNDSSVQDFGDNKFPHFKGCASTVRAYLQTVNDELDRSGTGNEEFANEQIGFLPESIHQFLSS